MNYKALLDSELIDGKYVLDMELGAGAFGSVYLATQLVLGKPMRQVALKLFKSDVINEDNVREQMTDALAVIELLSNETDWTIRQHFVTVYDLGVTTEDSPRGYVSMELVRGGNLQKRIESYTSFSLAGTLHYLQQLLVAMAYMHRNQFVHSDLKPENILVFASRDHDLIKIGDFGLSGKFQSHVGGSGPRGGTQAYLALEALMGVNTTPSCDVFSLGLIAYEMLTGKNPYAEIGFGCTAEQRNDTAFLNKLHENARIQQPLKLLRGHFPELTGSNPDPILGGMLDIINKMLMPTPEGRYFSADAALTDLNQLLGQSIARSSSASTSSNDSVSGSGNASQPQTVSQHRRSCESQISSGHWNEAIQSANQYIKESPEEPEGYLLKSKVFQEQAKTYAIENRADSLVISMRKQALAPLRKGLRKCPDSKSQRQMAQELANLYRLLGDDDTAQEYLSMGSAK